MGGMKRNVENYLAICEMAARAGGAALLDWRGRFQVREKGPSDPVTEADFASQEAIRGIIAKYCADHDFLSEEEPHSRIADGRYRWILDPLDGTQNYVHGVPIFAVSLALEKDGRLLVGCVYNPVQEECYTTQVGKGAYLNGQRLSVTRQTDLAAALVAVSLPPRVRRGAMDLENVVAVAEVAQGIRRFGSSALNLCWVAAGRLDAFFATDTKIWDVAAGALLVQEAGGTVTDVSGEPLDVRSPRLVAAATPELSAALRGVLMRNLSDSKHFLSRPEEGN
jgi:myo-inositol-1(or 4)-monophosphatase